jgi:hypothetical protein
VHAEEHVIAVQQDYKQVNNELLSVDEDMDHTTDACGGDTVTIGNLDSHIRRRQGIHVESARCYDRDNGMCGARVDKGHERVFLPTYIQLHHVSGGEARDDIE